ncbi:uncharacterized protein LOC117315983 [Pecten maximus]|uniref:uncharacterized protein LOC117315983 n=1 Tax=Pecten maximus TaxID=6579 RepID=UPI001458338D|nr:uncharacterized protein LOC117315983 [Pecten maximus]
MLSRNESVNWIGMRFNDSFSCKMKDKAKQWKFDGWGRWGRWNDLNVEPNGCPDKRCVRLRYNAMFTSWCSSLYQALCETDVSQTTSILTTTFSHTRAYTIEGVNEESVNSSTHFTISETTEASVDTMIPTTEAESVTSSDLTTISTSMTLVTSGVETDTCAKCCTVKNFTKLDQFELEESLHELRSQLAVNKTKLSVQRRKLISVYDPRPSSVVMGGVACSILAVIVGVIVLPDAVVSVRFVYTRFDRVHKRNKCFVV